MRLWNSIKNELRIVLNRKTLLYFLSIIAFMIISMMQYKSENSSILYLVDLIIGLSYTKKILILLCSYIGVTIFNKEIANDYYKYSSIRFSFKNYAFGKSVSCFIFILLVSLLCFCCSICILNVKYPLFTQANVESIIGNQAPTFLNNPGVFLFFIILNYCLSISIWGQLGLMLSVFIDDSLAIIFSPYVVSYVIENISLVFPKQISIYYLSRTIDVFKFRNFNMLIYPTIMLLSIICILIYINYKLIYGRINGKIN